jgi:hypothetical protein
MLRVCRTTRTQILRRDIVKSNLLVPAAVAALLFGSMLAGAQNAPGASSSAQSGTANTPTPGYNSSGNNLDTTSKSPQVNSSSAPPTAGQDKTHGNDMVSPNGSATDSGIKQADATRPDFSTLDKKSKGSLSAADVKGNPWLKKNFAKCDTDHDGTLDRAEYEACKQ